MGTLFDQQPRNYVNVKTDKVLELIDKIKRISKDTNLSIDQVIKIYEIKELERKNDLFAMNGDIHDEQMTGFGELLKNAISSLDAIFEAIENK
ncbi:hypothetical protein HQ865_05765 [Mucilaginibacter mali]|uniref:Uncharacterized protein n=1 Tax=Mucilaginibacter mali TaxID=2740462 RepID=A0A7D4UL47_9SPHI|nr:hypothetical protein [Mucilaginibacter mali]QKJ29281.1 hypothetical protein HQ865_05765 [Mucilaginibacter mali]